VVRRSDGRVRPANPEIVSMRCDINKSSGLTYAFPNVMEDIHAWSSPTFFFVSEVGQQMPSLLKWRVLFQDHNKNLPSNTFTIILAIILYWNEWRSKWKSMVVEQKREVKSRGNRLCSPGPFLSAT